MVGWEEELPEEGAEELLSEEGAEELLPEEGAEELLPEEGRLEGLEPLEEEPLLCSEEEEEEEAAGVFPLEPLWAGLSEPSKSPISWPSSRLSKMLSSIP